jgi:Zn-dependent metalloprotease
MKKTRTLLLVFALCCVMVTFTWAAKKVGFVKANSKAYIGQLNGQGVIGTSLGEVFGLTGNETVDLVRSRTDFNGVTHFRYQQSFNGIPVWGHQTVVSKGANGKVKRLNGTIVQGIGGDVGNIPNGLDSRGGLDKMKAAHMSTNPNAKWNFENEEHGTFIYLHNGKARLVHVVSFFADNEQGNPSRPVFFVDARNGKVIHSYDNLQSADGVGPGGNLKTGYYYYGTDYPPFGVTQNGSTCTMNTPNVKTVNLNHGSSGSTAWSFTCPENTVKQINGAYSPLNDAQYFGQVVFDMYQNWYGVPVLPIQLSMKVHYLTNHENAYWTGDSMLFGDGYSTFYPLVALDVAAHEVSHGFTDFNSDLIYSGQSGGINEAFSDMAGEGAKFYMKGTNDFRVGYDIFKSPTGALRYMYDPPLDGRSIGHVDDYYSGMDVHYSSGVFNKAFYQVATTTGWDTQMAFDIFVKANQDYWTPSTGFQAGAEGAQAAAADYGYPCQDVVDAFAVVGIPLDCGGTGGGDMFVQDISQTVSKKGKNYSSSAVVTIWDDTNSPVSNATVFITWSGVVSGSKTGVTGANGTVTFNSRKVKSSGPFTITVTNVTHASFTYNPALNIETSDSASF